MKRLVLLMGIAGAGKSSVTSLLPPLIDGRVVVDSEQHAFNRAFTEDAEPQSLRVRRQILDSIDAYLQSTRDFGDDFTLLIDRWYETYYVSAGLTPADLADIEDSIRRAGFEDACVINLVLKDDTAFLIDRLLETRRLRHDWWEAHLGSVDERARNDLETQRCNQKFGMLTSFRYLEIDSSAKDWDRYAASVIDFAHLPKRRSTPQSDRSETGMVSSSKTLNRLVAELDEVYQPIYRHAEYDHLSSRKRDGRLERIAAIATQLAEHKRGPISILDLGCAQGFMTLSLAETGAAVLGIDHNAKNIALCHALSIEDVKRPAHFDRDEVENMLDRIEVGEFDLMLGLSVFHHLCHRHGKEWVRDLIAAYLGKVPNIILETALATEPPAWAASQPEHPDYFVDGMPFHCVLDYADTHLSAVRRPLYFCSSQFGVHEGILRPL